MDSSCFYWIFSWFPLDSIGFGWILSDSTCRHLLIHSRGRRGGYFGALLQHQHIPRSFLRLPSCSRRPGRRPSPNIRRLSRLHHALLCARTQTSHAIGLLLIWRETNKSARRRRFHHDYHLLLSLPLLSLRLSAFLQVPQVEIMSSRAVAAAGHNNNAMQCSSLHGWMCTYNRRKRRWSL